VLLYGRLTEQSTKVALDTIAAVRSAARYGRQSRIKINMLRHIFLFLFVLNLGISAISQRSVAAPPADELFQGWRQWTEDLENLSPRRIDYEENNHMLDEWGFSTEKATSYRDGSSHYVITRERERIPGRPTDVSAFYGGIYHPKYYAILTRSEKESAWRIDQVKPPMFDRGFSDPFTQFQEIPGDIPPTDSAMSDLYDVEIVEESESEAVVRFDVRTPKPEIFRGGRSTVTQNLVTFEQAHNWLPTKITTTHERGFSETNVFSDWRTVAEVPVPFRIDSGKDPSGKDPFRTVEFKEIKLIPRDDVIERAQLSYYDLPEMDLREPKPVSWWWGIAALIGVLAAMGFWWIPKRARKT